MLVMNSVVKGRGVVKEHVCSCTDIWGCTGNTSTAPHWGLHYSRSRYSQLGTNIITKVRFNDLRQIEVLGKIIS